MGSYLAAAVFRADQRSASRALASSPIAVLGPGGDVRVADYRSVTLQPTLRLVLGIPQDHLLVPLGTVGRG